MARCPLLSRCSEKVNMEKFNDVCSNLIEDAYRKCDTYKKASGELKTPKEWENFFTAALKTA
ncbi:MAG: hypothetical protein QW734_07685 [Candidatus Bathyarchaeia archaeon]